MTDQMRVFDRALVARRRARAVASVDQVAPILEDAADRLLDRLDDTTRRFSRALDLGGRGFVAPKLAARGIPFVVSADLAPWEQGWVARRCDSGRRCASRPSASAWRQAPAAVLAAARRSS
jgi:hypothetical protein